MFQPDHKRRVFCQGSGLWNAGGQPGWSRWSLLAWKSISCTIIFWNGQKIMWDQGGPFSTPCTAFCMQSLRAGAQSCCPGQSRPHWKGEDKPGLDQLVLLDHHSRSLLLHCVPVSSSHLRSAHAGGQPLSPQVDIPMHRALQRVGKGTSPHRSERCGPMLGPPKVRQTQMKKLSGLEESQLWMAPF